MTSTGKIITGSVIGVSLVAGLSYLSRLRKMQKELVVVPSASLAKMNLDGLTIRVDAVLKNPTKGSFSMKFPFIKLLFKGAVIGSSQSVNQDIKMPPYGEARIEKVMVAVPLENIFSMAAGIIQSIQKKEVIKLTVVATTDLNLGWMNKNYTSTQEVTLAT